MNNNNENGKTERRITITMNIGALGAATNGIEETQRQKDGLWKSKRCKCCEEPDRCICSGLNDIATITILIQADREKECRIRIEASPSHYEVWEVVKDGTEIPLFRGKRGSVYEFVKKVHERISIQ